MKIMKLLLVLVVVGLMASCGGGENYGVVNSPSPEQAKRTAAYHEEEEKHAEIYRTYFKVRGALKGTMRNPDSFKVVSGIAFPDGTVCLMYRAQNGFGGMNVDTFVFTMKGNFPPKGIRSWNRYCANKKGGVQMESE